MPFQRFSPNLGAAMRIRFLGIAILLASGLAAAGPWARAPEPVATPAPRAARLDWQSWSEPFRAAPRPERAKVETELPAEPELDVVDAHWLALTMWGEARREGESGMRAVGHVIDNRRRAGMHGDFVTDTVSAPFQFSAWNPSDPNRARMMDLNGADGAGADARAWRLARQIAEDILAGRSADPTGGALYYHSVAVAPPWSAGVAPVARIGDHLFFRTAR